MPFSSLCLLRRKHVRNVHSRRRSSYAGSCQHPQLRHSYPHHRHYHLTLPHATPHHCLFSAQSLSQPLSSQSKPANPTKPYPALPGACSACQPDPPKPSQVNSNARNPSRAEPSQPSPPKPRPTQAQAHPSLRPVNPHATPQQPEIL